MQQQQWHWLLDYCTTCMIVDKAGQDHHWNKPNLTANTPPNLNLDLYIIRAQRQNTCFLTCAPVVRAALRPGVLLAPNEDSNQPAHLCSLIRVFVACIRTFSSLAILNAPSEDFDETDQNLHWPHMSKGTFPGVAVHNRSIWLAL